MVNLDEFNERYKQIQNYCEHHSLGNGANGGELDDILEGAVEDFQDRIGMVKIGKLIFKFMVEYFDPRDSPNDYEWLLYYNKKNLSKLIKRASHEESNSRIFGYQPAKIATEEEVRDNYNWTLKRFVEDYKNFKNKQVPIYDTYTSFTSEPNKINFEYFLSKKVCKRILVSRATNKNIFLDDPLGMKEYEVLDVVTQESYIEIISFEDWLIKYPKYSKGFMEYLGKHPRNVELYSRLLDDLDEEEQEIKNIMNKIIESL
ncbi:hypothetical protein [Lactococcus cremoris]|uniref:Uncharacterized protein n=1 Tax=Lactococcus cremoris subsp. tructae TaxID=542833 RepID=A0A2A5SN15_LACLC|nr:hypothetical protein [Lactococcus cremoris]PCS14895.1 hypothetical protein RU92_GL001951 [Lactococcus cremoris subsp. tructae]